MSSEAVPVKAPVAAPGALWRIRAAVMRIATNDVLLVSFALGLLVAVFFYDVLFLGRTLVTSSFIFGVMGLDTPYAYPEDPAYNVYLLDPMASAVAESTAAKVASLYHNFALPLWDGNTALGRPLLASIDPHAVNPLRLPIVMSPTSEVTDGFLVARFLVAGLFTYLFAKRLELSKLAAFAAAVAFPFSGFFMLYVNMPHVDFALLVPVILYAFDLLLERPGALAKVFAATVVALAILHGNPEGTVAVLVFGSAYYVARLAARVHKRRGLRPLKRLMPLAVIGVLGAGLTALVMVPFFELAGVLDLGGLSVHNHSPASEIGLKHDPLQSLITLFVPYFDGEPVFNFQGTGELRVRNYVGIVIPLLAILGLWNSRVMAKGGWFFLAAAVVLLAKTYGFPLVNWAGGLPVFNVMDIPLYFTPAVTFSLVILAAMGLDQLSNQRWRVWHLLVAILALAAILGWQVWLNRDILGDIPSDFLARNLGLAAALAFALVLAAMVLKRGLVPAHLVSLAIVGLIIGELFIFSIPVRGDFGIIARAVYGDDIRILERPKRHDPFTEPPFVTFLKEDDSAYRVFSPDYLLYPNTSSVYDIDDIRGFTALTVERYYKYITSFINPTARQRFTGAYLPPFRSESEPTVYAANELFNLLNVKYIITSAGLTELHDHSFIDAVLEANPARRGISLDVFRIDGIEEAVLFQHPTSSLSYDLTPSADTRFLNFRLALSPAVWLPDRGDGVLFQVSVADGDATETVFSRWVDPKNNPEDRRWLDDSVDLGPYLNRPVTLTFHTSPGNSGVWDLAGWGALRLSPSPDTPPAQPNADQFELVYDGEVVIHRNNAALPRAFIVHQANLVSDTDAAIARMSVDGFDPTETAVVEASPAQAELAALADNSGAGASEVEITGYEDGETTLRVETDRPGLLVLSDTYYPGWQAYVDGERTPIYPTDVALRSVYLEAGEHEVRFVYSPASFKLGAVISGLSLLALATFAGWGTVRSKWATLRERADRGEARGGPSD